MASTIIQSGSQTAVINTEHTLAGTGDASDLPVGSTYILVVDLTNMAGGDTLELRIYIKVKSAASYILMDLVTFSGSQSSAPGLQSIPVPTAVGTRMTLKQTAGTGRVYDWSAVAL